MATPRIAKRTGKVTPRPNKTEIQTSATKIAAMVLPLSYTGSAIHEPASKHQRAKIRRRCPRSERLAGHPQPMKMLQPYLGGTGQQPHTAGPCLFPRAPAGPPWPARLAPPTRSQLAYTLHLPEKLNPAAYTRSLGGPQIGAAVLREAHPPRRPARASRPYCT